MNEPTTELPFARRVALVFAAPRRLFATFRESPPMLDALVLATLVTVLTILAMPDAAFVLSPENAVNRRGAPVEITSSPEEIARFGRYLGMLGTAVTHPLLALGVAGALTLLFSVLGGGQASFRQYLAVTSHALLISALGLVVVVILDWIDPGASRWLAPAAFLPSPPSPDVGYALAASFDVFTLWMLGVLALGVSVLDGRRSWPVAAVVVYGLSVALVAARSALLA